MPLRPSAIDRTRAIAMAGPACCAVLGALAAWLLVRLLVLPWLSAGPASQTGRDAPANALAPPPVRSIASWHLFGNTPSQQGAGGAAASTLSLILRGTVAERDPKAGIAVIAGPDGSERAYRVGEEVGAGVRLAEVHPDRIVLAHGGSEETLRLPRDTRLAPADVVRAAPAGASSATPRATATVAASAAPVAAAGATPSGAQQVIARLRQNPAELMQRVQVAPVFDNGRMTGVRIDGADAALASASGLRVGDVVTQVNGAPVDSPARAQQILAGLGTASSVRVTVLRDGKPTDITVGLQ